MDPITITEFVDITATTNDLKVKICNNVFMDPQKILSYNGSEIDYESYKFLAESFRSNDMFEGKDWHTYSTLSSDRFILSSRILEEFNLDLHEFMIACQVGTTNTCTKLFKPVIDNFMFCYEAVITIHGIGLESAIKISMYFDPEINLGKHTSYLGAIILASHPEDYLQAVGNGIFLLPNEAALVDVSSTYRTQTQSFPNAPCVDKKGLEMHNFTGKPFYTTYSIDSCMQMCYSKVFYDNCNCAPYTSWNVTNTECLEDRKNWECIRKLAYDKEAMAKMPKCATQCAPMCEQKMFDVRFQKKSIISRQSHRDSWPIRVYLNEFIEDGSASSLAPKLLEKLEKGASENISENIGFAQIWMKSPTVTVLTIEPKVTFVVFLSNAGGLLGMWLGVSALSFLTFLESFIYKTELKFRKTGNDDPENRATEQS